jgi:uncharacterized protein
VEEEKRILERCFVHLFQYKDRRFLLDAPTSTSLQLDTTAYRVLKQLQEKTPQKAWQELQMCCPQKELTSVRKELDQLKRYGFLKPVRVPPLHNRGDAAGICHYPPHHLVLMVSQTCNLRCKYCYGGDGSYGGSRSVMPQETALKIVDLLVDRSPKKECGFTFFGGEPLLNFQLIKKTVAYAKQRAREKGKWLRFHITTNGTLMGDEVMSFLVKEGFGILISHDGPKKVHDQVRVFPDGGGTFDAVGDTIMRLKRRQKRFSLRATVTHRCVSLKSISEFFSDKGFSQVHIHPVSQRHHGEAVSGLELDTFDYNRLLRQYEQVAQGVIRCFREKKPVIFNPFRKYLDLIKRNARRSFPCGVCRGMSAVSTDGNIYPCHRFVGMEPFIIGTVDSGFDSKKIKTLLKRYRSAREICRSCWAVFLCAGGCMYDVANPDGSFAVGENENCRITKKLIELSVLIYSESGPEKSRGG